MSLSRSEGDIAWITAAGISGNSVYLDNLQFEPVPEPATFALLGLGVAVVLAKRRR